MATKRTTKKAAAQVPAPVEHEAKGQAKVISEVTRLVDEWRGFALGSARDPYPEPEALYQPTKDGERPISMTTHALLAHWFRHDPHLLGRIPHTYAFKYWPHQRRLVETIIYLHEVRGIRRTEELYALTGVEPLEPQRDPWAKLGGQLATGSGKTKMMSLLIAWAYLNAVLEADNVLGFGRHILVIAPGLFVRDRLLQDFAPPDGSPSVFSADPVIPPEFENAWDLRVYSPDTCPLKLDPAEGTLVVTNYHQLLRSRQDAPDLRRLSPEERQMELLFRDNDPARLEAIESPLLERFSRSNGILVLNDEAHHVGDEPAHAQFEQRARDRARLSGDEEDANVEAMAWIRSLRKLNGSTTASVRINLQVDLSATLYAEAGTSKKQDAQAFRPFDLFRHTVVRYDLKDAIPDGIVKKPILERVVVKNAATGETEPLVRTGQPNAWEKYRNILVTGIERWKKVRHQFEDEGDPRKPILFILCDNRNEAKEVANYLKYGEASVDADSSADRIPTGFRDPRDPNHESLFLFKDAAGSLRSTVLEIHIGEKENRSEADWEKVRNAVNAIDHDFIPDPSGRKDSDGRPLMVENPYNVVVSVMMLKEGWDVRNVKVIVPLRPCDSRTLTEQTLGRGLRKMHRPEIDDEGAATITNEELYVIEHESFRSIIDQIRDILVDGTGEDAPREYVPILQRDDLAERQAFDVRLPRFETVHVQPLDWRKTFQLPTLDQGKKLLWRDEIADTEIKTFLKHALEQGEETGQSFVLEGTSSYSDFDHILELAYAVPLLRELRTSYQHKNAVKDVVREMLERRTFRLPAGIPLRFGVAMEPDDARIALGNLARPDVIEEVKKALLPALRKALTAERQTTQGRILERRAADLRNYQALKTNVVQALQRSSFQQAAVANSDERAFALLVDRSVDVTGWLYNDRHGVGFSIPYDWNGRTAQYFPDFIVRAKLGAVHHNFIVEIKGRLDDRDKAKARAGEAYCELLTQYDREPWHYILLIENTPIGREDIKWWGNQSEYTMADLYRHLERQPLLPEGGGASTGRPFQLLETRPEGAQNEAVPVYDLAVAAGAFSESQTPEAMGWAIVKTRRTLDPTMFIAVVLGKSMEEGIPDGSYCLFRGFEAGTAPGAIALDGRRVVVELREAAEPELGGRYTLKRWKVVKLDSNGGVEEIELRPDNRGYRTIRLRAEDGEIRVVAEMVEVVG